MLDFPQISRKPALKTRTAYVDPTIRDSMENGMETSRPRFTRSRRQWEVSIDLLTPADVRRLDNFVTLEAKFGALAFNFPDKRDPKHPATYQVRFATLPAYTDAGSVKGEFRQSCTFTIREM